MTGRPGCSSRWRQIIKAAVESGGKINHRSVITDNTEMCTWHNPTFDFARNFTPEFDRCATELRRRNIVLKSQIM